MISSKRFDELKATGELPSPSGVALEVMRLTQAEDSSVQDLARVIQADPALAGRLLKFSNSPFVGPRRPIVAVSDAVVLVGMHVVRQLSLGLSILSENRCGRCTSFDYVGFWSRSLAKALAFEALSAHKRYVAPEEAFSCGLLSEIGQLALASIYPDAYQKIMESGLDYRGPEWLEREQEEFATDHREMTAALLEDWGLPAVQIEAVLAHYDLSAANLEPDSRGMNLARQLYLAGLLAEVCVSDDMHRIEPLPEINKVCDDMSITEEDLGTMLQEITEAWKEWGQLLEVPTQEVPELKDLEESLASLDTQTGGASDIDALKVLVVDDDVLTLKRLSKQLETIGHQVTTAENGEEGLARALENPVDLIITDWRMPKMDGLEFCRALRETRFGQKLYIIMLTACESDDELVQAFDAGANDYVVKPFSPRVLEARIRGGERIIKLQHNIEREQEENRAYMAELAVANRRLEQMAMTDTLTELPNRRYAMNRLEQEWANADRTGGSLSLLSVDLDHFKMINDQFGHEAGDQVLCAVAKVMRDSMRASDVICRVGGEEFIAILPNTDAASAKDLAERLRVEVEKTPVTVDGHRIEVTLSVGIVARTPGLASWNELLKNADGALYQAKQGGRNQVCAVRSAATG